MAVWSDLCGVMCVEYSICGEVCVVYDCVCEKAETDSAVQMKGIK